jgi:hypothetical protein
MTATVRGISTDGRDGSIDRKLVREYTVTYLVTTDDWSDGPQAVRTAFGIPDVGDVYTPGNDYDAQAMVISKRVSQRDAPDEWEVEVTYSTEPGDKQPEQAATPLEEPPVITCGANNRQIIVQGCYATAENPDPGKDWDWYVHSTNGELYDPQPEVEISEPLVTIQRNVQTISWPYLVSLADCVNQSPFFGADARQLKLKAPKATSAYDPSVGNYWQLTYEIAFKYDTWDIQILNRGSFYYDTNFAKVPFKDLEGNRFVGLLDAIGSAINYSSDQYRGVYYAGGQEPTFTRIRYFREIDFTSLGIL